MNHSVTAYLQAALIDIDAPTAFVVVLLLLSLAMVGAMFMDHLDQLREERARYEELVATVGPVAAADIIAREKIQARIDLLIAEREAMAKSWRTK